VAVADSRLRTFDAAVLVVLGTEDPNIFQPTGLNTDQWATSLKDSGFKGAVLTAKHHDGFLLFYELMSRYGSIDELRLDGANPNGRNQPYNFSDWIKIVRALQPNASIENDDGPDIRWVGNENGYARQSEWSAVPYTGNASTAADTIANPPDGYAPDLGSDNLLSQRKRTGPPPGPRSDDCGR
jgi:alpha-L-fucosidase